MVGIMGIGSFLSLACREEGMHILAWLLSGQISTPVHGVPPSTPAMGLCLQTCQGPPCSGDEPFRLEQPPWAGSPQPPSSEYCCLDLHILKKVEQSKTDGVGNYHEREGHSLFSGQDLPFGLCLG